jgi:hypothetical protein
MALRFSTGLRDAVASGFGWREALRDGRLYVYSGTQPTNADTDVSGTLLVPFTLSGGSYTSPVRSAATLTLTGSSGSLDTLKVGGLDYNLLSGAVSFDSDLTTTAAAVASDINGRQNPLNITASSSSGVVTLYTPYWLGAMADGLTIATTETTLGVSVNGGLSSTFGGAGSPNGGTTAVNGLNFQFPASSGVLSKESTVWQGTAAASGTAGWFRFVAGGSSVSGASTTDLRFDGSIATSGADMNISNTSVTSGAVQTINTFSITAPANNS